LTVTESEQSFAARPPGSVWRGEPFRIFFPLGVVLGWIGIGHWLLYTTGWSTTYSCMGHGFVQMQAFMMAFAVGFLLTALPRRTRSAAPSHIEMALFAGALVWTTAAAITERWLAAQAAYAFVFLLLLQFAVRRFARAGRRPPASFVLIPFALVHGIGGAALIALSTVGDAPVWMLGLGRRMVEQGVFLCFVVGIGSLFLPLVAGMPPPADLGSSPRERWKAVGYFAAGIGIFLSLLVEELGGVRSGPLLRAAIVAIALGYGAGAVRGPRKPGFHRRLIWLAVWLIPVGLVLSAIAPDYRVPALHVVFVGGFSLMAFAVATHVSLGHLGFEDLAAGRPPAIVAVAVAILVALAARVVADFTDSYFEHLGWAAAAWLVGSSIWLGFLGPKLLRRSR